VPNGRWRNGHRLGPIVLVDAHRNRYDLIHKSLPTYLPSTTTMSYRTNPHIPCAGLARSLRTSWSTSLRVSLRVLARPCTVSALSDCDGSAIIQSPRAAVESGPILIEIRCTLMCFRLVRSFDLLGWGSGSFVVEDVEDAHPQHEHCHPQHEDGTIEGSIARMSASSPKTHVIHRDFEHRLQQP
jgi:hypothetical protein